MRKRFKPNQSKSRKQFSRTAATHHPRNRLDTRPMRGGNRM